MIIMAHLVLYSIVLLFVAIDYSGQVISYFPLFSFPSFTSFNDFRYIAIALFFCCRSSIFVFSIVRHSELCIVHGDKVNWEKRPQQK